jgi:hypothetical protein
MHLRHGQYFSHLLRPNKKAAILLLDFAAVGATFPCSAHHAPFTKLQRDTHQQHLGIQWQNL